MFKTIFGKHIFLYLSIIIISFLVLGTSLTQFYKSYFTQRQETMLVEQGSRMAGIFASGSSFGMVTDKISSEASILKEYLDSDFMYTDSDFTIIMKNSGSEVELGKAVDINRLPNLANTLNGEVVIMEGNLFGVYNESKLIVAYPVVYPYLDNQVIGVIFMSSSMESLKANISEVARITTIGVIVTGMFAFVLIYLSSKSISKPLQQMNEVAKIITNGDFEKRIEIKGIDEVSQLAQSFNDMAQSLEEQESTRREFIANISHDLRSPLTSIIGFLQAIKDGTVPVEKQERYISIILDECTRLSKLANDLLDVSKMQVMGDLSISVEEFDINELIRNVVIQFENRVIKKDIDLEILFVEEKTTVKADYDKIKRVMYNLIDNAVKFTPNAGKIKIETTTNEDKVFISIKDNGKGIAEDEKKRIFERFYKADASRGQDKTGSGLGLAIVNEFVKAHDEKIYIKSDIDKGSEFIFTLTVV